MWGLSIAHWVVVIFVLVLLFGKNTVSKLMADIGGAVKNTKKALKEIDNG